MEFDGDPRPRVRMMEAVYRNFRTGHRVQVCDKLRKPVDPKLARRPEPSPVDTLAHYWDSREPRSRGPKLIEAPVGRYEQRRSELWLSVQQPRQPPQSAAAEIATGVKAVLRPCGMDVVDAEANRRVLARRQPAATWHVGDGRRGPAHRATVVPRKYRSHFERARRSRALSNCAACESRIRARWRQSRESAPAMLCPNA